MGAPMGLSRRPVTILIFLLIVLVDVHVGFIEWLAGQLSFEQANAEYRVLRFGSGGLPLLLVSLDLLGQHLDHALELLDQLVARLDFFS